MAEILLDNRELIDLHYIFYNSSPLLTEVILSNKDVSGDYGELHTNTDPELAELIIANELFYEDY
jgi:hypothetical protein